MRRKPIVLGALIELGAYWRALLRRDERDVPPDFAAFRRAEQWSRIISVPSELLATSHKIEPTGAAETGARAED